MKTRILATHSPPAVASAITAAGAKSADKFMTGRQTNCDQCVVDSSAAARRAAGTIAQAS